MSRTHPREAAQQEAGEDNTAKSLHPTVSPLPPPDARRRDEEAGKEAERKAELDRFLQYRARLEFAELMTRRQQVEGEGVEEDEEVERMGRGRNVGRVSDLKGFEGSAARTRGGGALAREGKRVGRGGSDDDGGGGGDGGGSGEKSCDSILLPPPPQPGRNSSEEDSKSNVDAEIDGLRGRMGKLNREIMEVRRALEERREQEQRARSSLLPSFPAGEGGNSRGVYLPSSPILSSLDPAEERRETG